MSRSNLRIAVQAWRAERGVGLITKAIALKPDHADAYNNRGVALQDLKRPEEALASYDKAIALKPDFAEACTVYMAAVVNTSLTLHPSARCCAKRR